MSLTKKTDGHTLTIKVDYVVTEPQLLSIVNEALKKAKEDGYDIRYFHNPIKNKGANSGRYFFWFNDTKVYNMVLGLNPDGSSRVERFQDPDWVAPEIDFSATTSWADIADEEEAPIIENVLPSLIPIGPIPLTKEQTEGHLEKAEIEYPRIDPAYAHDASFLEDKSYNTLKSSALHPTMTEEFIKNEFKIFSRTKNVGTKKIGKGKNTIIQKEAYPLVKIVERKNYKTGKNERIAFITFDPETRDASFAAHMMFSKEHVNNRTKEKFTVYYRYAPDNKSSSRHH